MTTIQIDGDPASAEPSLPRTTIVTGSGAGAGLAIAERLAAGGSRVLVVDLDPARVEAAVKRLPSAVGIAIDVTAPNAAQEILDACIDRFGRVDALVNNAAIFPSTPLGSLESATVTRIFQVNVTAPLLLMDAVISRWRADHTSGSIVNLLSVGAFRPSGPSMLAYCASKAALWSATKTIACSVAKENIRVNGVAPGPINHQDGRENRIGLDPELYRAAIDAELAKVPMGRQVLGAEIAEAVAFLLSSRASATTGVALAVDGGATAA